jgi:cytochrome c peroxidase
MAAVTIRVPAGVLAALALASAGCGGAGHEVAVRVDSAQLALFAPLPDVMVSAANPITDAKIELGRRLFFETKLSLGNDLSCDGCHDLGKFGADTGAVSAGHLGKTGTRNAPTVYNAAGQVAQFWDGRASDVEAQALVPILDTVEMAMPSGRAVVARLRADTLYRRMFAAAFPGERDPITFPNLGRAVGAFERKLVTPSRWDRFLRHDVGALTNAEKAGFNTFAATGCITCHNGTYVGGAMYMKAGVVRPWPDTTDPGRMAITHQPGDRMVFKVPSLRNVEHTGPYFHNGAVRSLDTAVVWMARYQLGKTLSREQAAQIVTWLRALSGVIPARYVARPAGMPASK